MLLLNETNFDWQRSNVKINSTAETGHKVPNFSRNKNINYGLTWQLDLDVLTVIKPFSIV